MGNAATAAQGSAAAPLDPLAGAAAKALASRAGAAAAAAMAGLPPPLLPSSPPAAAKGEDQPSAWSLAGSGGKPWAGTSSVPMPAPSRGLSSGELEGLGEIECLERAARLLRRANDAASELERGIDAAHGQVSACVESLTPDPPGCADPLKAAALEAAEDLVHTSQRKALERMRKVLALRKQLCNLARDTAAGGVPGGSPPCWGCAMDPHGLPGSGLPRASPVPLFGGIGPGVPVWSGAPPPVDGGGQSPRHPSWAPVTPRKH